MIKRYSLLLVFIANVCSFAVKAQNKPFPQAISYPGCIKPSNVTQAAMNTSVASYYDYWKSQYLKNNLSSLPGGYYVKGDITGKADGYTPLGSSEGQGYGMVIVALMAGHDPNARTIFDGLFKTFRAYHSSVNSNLMGWVVADASSAQGHFDSATDGDMDIAYSLLLAHYQWGSGGTINYLSEAKKVIAAIKSSNVTTTNRLNLSDNDSKSALNTRPSDWMMDHMRAFAQETNDNTWTSLINNLYNVYSQFTASYSSSTGLISDFVVANPPKPAPRNYLEEFPETDEYNYNACRVPLRIVMDYAMYGSTPALNVCNKLVNWVKTKTNSNPTAIIDGYKLNGGNTGSGQEAVFIGPFVAASVVNSGNQAFLNSGWNYLKSAKSGYYSDSYGLLCQLFISGNWWIPGAGGGPVNNPPTVSITSPAANASFTAPATVTINATAADSDGTVKKVEFFNGATKLGEDTTSPYSYTWNNVAAGSYSLTAKATDNGNAATTSAAVNISVAAAPGCTPVDASGDDGNVAANVLDNDLNTRWSASGEQWLRFCLGSAQTVTGVDIAFYKGDTRKASFDIQISQDGASWTNVATGKQSSGTSNAFESFNFTGVTAKYVRILGHGNNVNAWNSYTEVKVKTTTQLARTAGLNAVDDAPAKANTLSVNAFPNPFRDNLTITYNVQRSGPGSLTVYNVSGQPIAILANGQLSAGTHQATFQAGRHPGGVYILKLVQQGNVVIKRIVKE
ncbi:glycosyl hydrolase family 8 [Chitinophaga solisilvae]|uniref:Glucanase n=1 Tax=Chitinophaga solisilvae TaxID=1233460 RepID=A0A3S1JGA6_9BACT|nr:glycosyl hydrolase family 8 [Chitinophaga solisilvae]NSL87346.1 T9SS type A sorting domain-containing protein [Chitinophaga solisilvae]